MQLIRIDEDDNPAHRSHPAFVLVRSGERRDF